MNAEDFARYVEERYLNQCQWYDGEATRNKRRYYAYQTLIVGCSAVATMAVAAGVYWPEAGWVRLVALGMTVSVSALVSLQKVFRHQEQWLEYRTTAEALKKEKPMYDARIGEYEHAESAERLFVSRVESWISTQNTKWVESTRQAGS